MFDVFPFVCLHFTANRSISQWNDWSNKSCSVFFIISRDCNYFLIFITHFDGCRLTGTPQVDWNNLSSTQLSQYTCHSDSSLPEADQHYLLHCIRRSIWLLFWRKPSKQILFASMKYGFYVLFLLIPFEFHVKIKQHMQYVQLYAISILHNKCSKNNEWPKTFDQQLFSLTYPACRFDWRSQFFPDNPTNVIGFIWFLVWKYAIGFVLIVF